MSRLNIRRKEREKVYIGDNIVVQIMEARSGYVKLCIEAPKDVKIMRAELVKEEEASKNEG